MKLGFIGLGRMGFNMALNLKEHGHTVVATDINQKAVQKITKHKIKGVYLLSEMVQALPTPKVIWLMIPAGKPVNKILEELVPLLKRGDIVIDGGNSYFEDSRERYKMLKQSGINFLDCGVSGGVAGARHGACMMIGGEKEAFKKVEVLFRAMCVKDGYGYMGKSGTGHFVKMVHNGIEYGMMGAIAEGIEALKKSPSTINIKEAVKAYAHGSIIESKLMSLVSKILQEKKYLNSISGEVPLGETEKKMVKFEKLTNMPILHQARVMREKTRKKPTFAGKLIAAMRNQFGGHAVKKK